MTAEQTAEQTIDVKPIVDEWDGPGWTVDIDETIFSLWAPNDRRATWAASWSNGSTEARMTSPDLTKVTHVFATCRSEHAAVAAAELHDVAQVHDDRAAVIRGMRRMAHWFEDHPEVPVPWRMDGQHSADSADEVDRLAAIMGVPVTEHAGHRRAELKFGGATFIVVHISVEAHRRSHDGAVEPEAVPS